MPYVIENRSGDPIVIPDGALNTDYSIDLVGRNYENYGQIIAKTQIDLLDNFATNNTPPDDPTSGQLWYDKDNKVLRSYDGTSGSWLPTRPLVAASAPTNQHGQNKAGTQYFNTSTGQLYVNTGGTGFQLANRPGEISQGYVNDSLLGNPSYYGTSIRNIFLKDTDGVDRPVLAVYYRHSSTYINTGFYQGEKIIAIFSGHTDAFTVGNSLSTTDGVPFNFYDQLNPVTEPGAIGLTIRPGMNVRIDDKALVNNSRKAYRSDAAYSINTGYYSLDFNGEVNDNLGANIAGGDLYHKGIDCIPLLDDTVDLGSTTRAFAEGHINDVYIERVLPSSSANGTVSVGTTVSPIDEIYADTFDVRGNIVFPVGGNIGTTSQRVTKINITNLYTNGGNVDINGYRMPAATGTSGQQIYLDAQNRGFFADPISNIKYVSSPNSSVDVSLTDNIEQPIGTLSLLVKTLNVEANVDYNRSLLSISSSSEDDLSYNPATGEISYTRVTPFDNLVPATHFMLLQGEQSQIATGIKTFANAINIARGVDIGGQINYGALGTYPASLGLGDNPYSNLTFGTRDNDTNTEHTIVFTKTGGIVADGDVTAFSDERLKEDIAPISNALDKVKQISGYTFTRKESGTRHAGVIAQEVQKVLPEVISEDEEGMLSVAYGNMVGLLLEAIKDLSAEVEDLKKQLSDK